MDRRKFLKTAATGAVATAGAATIAAPAISQNRRQWRIATTWPKNAPGLSTGANVIADFVGKATDGRLTIQVFGAGEIVPPFETLSAVANGTIEMGHGYPAYWAGLNPAMNFLAPVPFSLTPQEQNAWYRYGGGEELAQQIYNDLGVHFFVSGNVAAQGHGWFNREINSIADYQGLKMRIGGLGGRVLAAAGATVTSIPLGEVLPSLQSGAIDAAEFVGPLNDLAFGLPKAAKYYYWPGWQEPSGILDCFVNLESWNSLEDDLKEVLRGANAMANEIVLSEYNARNAEALRQITGEMGIEARRLSDETLIALGTLSGDVIFEEAQKDPMSMKLYESMMSFRGMIMPYMNLADLYLMQARLLEFPYVRS